MKELNNNNNLENKDEIIKLKREKLKPIQVRRSIKDILIDKNPCDYIYNYTGRNISIFPKDLLSNNENIKDSFNESENDKNNSEKEVISTISINEHEQKLLEELKELLKKDLSNEMKDNIKSLFIEVQEFYLEIKNDLKINYPSTEDLLKLYSTNDCSDKSKNAIWKSFCFYKLLSDQLNDLHISTISSYRLQCLKTIYRWYNKNKRILFNCKNDKKKINLFDEEINKNDSLNGNFDNTYASTLNEKTNLQNKNNDSIEIKENDENNENNENNEEKKKDIEEDPNEIKDSKSKNQKEYTKEFSEDFDKLLKEHIQITNEQNEKYEDIELNKKNEITDNESNNILNNYIYPYNTIISKIECEQKKESILKNNAHIENNNKSNEEKREEDYEHKSRENNTYEEYECKNFEKLNSDKFNFNSTLLGDEKDDFYQIPIDTKKIKELEEEIKKQKLLIKKKEIEIINSPIGIKFKDIFGNFQDIDINN
ncbi:conserved Plasmodium protein, unknown function [Plasmodium gallinaceum]|uniref:Uncharacterized protein n=1 Tax=Plasmodium gallinaceum TaxID=5849 RepID=A0A1J1GPZ6_PLAGA|nr:conserved Plasmodium protein, unknown function [Plasmodium gallinaceum]CRG94372.1 conserved Plasmodium protein, unknown function [Plasmodium gallinaceum]